VPPIESPPTCTKLPGTGVIILAFDSAELPRLPSEVGLGKALLRTLRHPFGSSPSSLPVLFTVPAEFLITVSDVLPVSLKFRNVALESIRSDT
jgi:hypothetical protein